MAKRKSPRKKTSVARADGAPILSLDTFTNREHISIDGAVYDLFGPGDLSIFDYHRLAKDSERLQKLMEKEDPSQDEERELSSSLDRICRRILDAPDEIHGKLRDSHRFAIAKVFTQLRQENRLRLSDADAAEAESTGAN